jgi:hypothetical protein
LPGFQLFRLIFPVIMQGPYPDYFTLPDIYSYHVSFCTKTAETKSLYYRVFGFCWRCQYYAPFILRYFPAPRLFQYGDIIYLTSYFHKACKVVIMCYHASGNKTCTRIFDIHRQCFLCREILSLNYPILSLYVP